MRTETDEAAERFFGGTAPLLLTCEHASARLPDTEKWADADLWLPPTHWAFDLGARDFVLELASHLGCPAVLARFSRLWADANRAETDADLFRTEAEGRAIALNAHLSDGERERRLREYHRPYHAAVDRMLSEHPGRLVFSVHTFTPVYHGEPREVEVGVLFDEEDDLAADLALALFDQGQDAWLNEPYSGKEGLIFSASSHAKRSGRIALELEIRQDLATDPAWRSAMIPKLAAALAEVGLL